MTVYRAAWVCPISAPPVAHGWFAIRDGRVAAVGKPGQAAPDGARDLGHVAVMPGLVNAHTHLELSWLRDRIPRAADFVSWVKQLVITRGLRHGRTADPVVIDAARRAAREARLFGTAAVGDISNTLAAVGAVREAGLRGLVFHELLGFAETDGRLVDSTRARRADAAVEGGDEVRVSVCPHAPYSTSAELFRAVRAEVDQSSLAITSVHLGESVSEIELLRDGTGPWLDMLRFIGAVRDGWTPPRASPVEYLDRLGMLDDRTLVVHGVQLDDVGLDRLAAIGCTLVTCPRSNQWVGAGVPPIERFYASGVKVAVGTDSLASVEDLNVFEELRTMRWLAPRVPARRLLESATLRGAAALGLDGELGSIEEGKRAELLAIALPPAVGKGTASRGADADEVEEHLVSGIADRDIRWVA